MEEKFVMPSGTITFTAADYGEPPQGGTGWTKRETDDELLEVWWYEGQPKRVYRALKGAYLVPADQE